MRSELMTNKFLNLFNQTFITFSQTSEFYKKSLEPFSESSKKI